jgi:CRP-like cAMP-binding protein
MAASRPARCRDCPAYPDSVWTSLDPTSHEVLDKNRTGLRGAAGQVVADRAGPHVGAMCIRSGTAAVWRTDDVGRSALVRIVEPGELAVLPSRQLDSRLRVECTEPLVGCTVEGEALEGLLARNPTLARRVIDRQHQVIQELERRLLHNVTLSVRARLVTVLLELRHKHGTVDDEGVLHLKLPMTRQQLAAIVGTRPETLARTLGALTQDGVALFDGRNVEIPDLDSLFDEIEAE